MRAVNALLTALDSLRRLPNVLTLATSNITSAIDPAFLDRADIKAFVGPPGEQARYEILRSCLTELLRAGIVVDCPALLSYSAVKRQALQLPGLESLGDMLPDPGHELSSTLVSVARVAEGMSGRALRRLPFLAHAGGGFTGGRTRGREFMDALEAAAERELQDRKRFGPGCNE